MRPPLLRAHLAIALLCTTACFEHGFPTPPDASDVVVEATQTDGVVMTDSSDAGDVVNADSDAQDATFDGPQTFVYVITGIGIDPPPPTAGTVVAGFNVDNLWSSTADTSADGCMQADYVSMADQDQNCASVGAAGHCANPGCASGSAGCVGGVDNQLPELLAVMHDLSGTNIRADLTTRIQTNQSVTLIRFTGVDSMVNDPSVNVFIYDAFPTFDLNCIAVPSGGTYRVSRSSLVVGASTIDDAVYSFQGSINNGRLQITPTTTPGFLLQIPLGTNLNNFPLYYVQMRGSWGASWGGMIGGWIPQGTVTNSLCYFYPARCSTIMTEIAPLADISVPATNDFLECGNASGCVCSAGGISVGFSFGTLPALIDPTTPIEAAQQPNTCGYVAPATDAGPG